MDSVFKYLEARLDALKGEIYSVTNKDCDKPIFWNQEFNDTDFYEQLYHPSVFTNPPYKQTVNSTQLSKQNDNQK